MDIKRVMSGVFGLPLVVIIFLIGNKYIIDVLLAIVTFISIGEYFKAVQKISNPVKWLGNICCIFIALIHFIPQEYLCKIIVLTIPSVLIILFLQVVITEMKTNFKDIAYTFLGIFYIVFFVMFLALIYGMENGKILIWYAFIASWGTDIFAYLVGKYFGKHKFSKISPKKSIEGCIGGILGAVVLMTIYTCAMNNFVGTNYSYVYIIIIGVVLSIVSQIGDFSASSIKRFVDIKDYSELIPGHGGMLDRIDSLIFLAPFAYILLSCI